MGTGAISEIADKETDLFYRSGMQDLLEQRIETILHVEEQLLSTRNENKSIITLKTNFGALIEVLCAGECRTWRAT